MGSGVADIFDHRAWYHELIALSGLLWRWFRILYQDLGWTRLNLAAEALHARGEATQSGRDALYF